MISRGFLCFHRERYLCRERERKRDDKVVVCDLIDSTLVFGFSSTVALRSVSTNFRVCLGIRVHLRPCPSSARSWRASEDRLCYQVNPRVFVSSNSVSICPWWFQLVFRFFSYMELRLGLFLSDRRYVWRFCRRISNVFSSLSIVRWMSYRKF